MNHEKKRTMLAAVTGRYGGPEVIAVKEVEKPVPRPGELLVRVRAAAVNSGDVRSRSLNAPPGMKLMIRLVMGWDGPRRPILGTVFAGEVEEAAGGFAIGDRVYGSTPGMRFGCHAQYLTVPSDGAVAAMPRGAAFDEAVSLLFGGNTALYFLKKAAPRAGQRLLVYGASGAVGTSAVQIGKALGLEVTGVASAANEALVRSLGADGFIDYRTQDYAADGAAYDIVLDAVGKTDKKAAARALKPQGRFLTVASLDVAKDTREQIDQLSAWYEQGQLKPVIDRTYPLQDAVQAHAYVDQGHKRGNVILVLP